MKKLLYILGAFTLVVIVIGTVGAGALIYNGNELDAQSQEFVDSAIPAIAGNWSEKQLIDRSTPELLKSTTAGQLDALFEQFSKLGPLVEYQGAKGQSMMSYFSGSGGTESASFDAKARFQNGDATFQLALIKRGGRWLINNFRVNAVPGSRPGQRTL